MVKPRPQVEKLVPYVPGKPIEELERELGIEGAVKLASNENPLGPSPRAVEAVRSAAADVHRYPDGGCYHLRRELARRLGVEPDNIILGNGSNEVLELVARTFLGPGDEAVMGEYAFIVFPLVTMAVGARCVLSPMPGMVHDLDDMLFRITPATRVVFLANPNNPTGTFVDRASLERFLAEVPEDVLVVVDEAYYHYAQGPDYLDTTTLLGTRKALVTTRTFSKVYGLAGLRVGYGVSDAEIIDWMNRVREPFNVNSLAQRAALAALEDDRHVARSVETNARGKQFLERELAEMGVVFWPSRTNFILIDVGRDAGRVYEKLLARGVIVRPVAPYGLRTHLRVTVGAEEENARFIEALRAVLTEEGGDG